VDSAFQQRRKTLINALSSSSTLGIDKKHIEQALVQLNFDPRIRGEKLQVEDYVALTNILQQYAEI
jgi:16S rRNA (adenine1518-N6/adenine1519-N6)-dimethyltransferase